MRHLLRNSILVVGLLVLMFSAFFPPQKNLRLGKDLRGGTTLLYAVQIDRSEDAGDVLDRTIEVLKERVDPQGLFEIRMVAQGNDRIEVTMPLPGPEVEALRSAFRAELGRLNEQSINAAEFERIMRLPPGERDTALDALAGTNAERRELLGNAANQLDDITVKRELLRNAEELGTPDAELDAQAAAIAQAEIDYDTVREEVLSSVLDPETLRRALELPTTKRALLNDAEELEYLPSPRERAMEEIRAQHAGLSGVIDDIEGAFNTYAGERTSLDDPNDLKRLLAGSGVLTFRIAVSPSATSADNTHPEEQRLRRELRENGPRNVQARDARWFKINDPFNALNIDEVALAESFFANPGAYALNAGYVVEPYEGEFFMLLWDTRSARMTKAEGTWSLADAYPTRDQINRPAIGFEMDTRGARRLGDLTGEHIGRQMAVLLDDEVYTAPVLQARISRNGIIQGDFSQQEISYVIRTLNAGSLQARLSPEPLSENTIAPDLGKDNLDAGTKAGIAALIAVSVFMVFYYFGYGLVAVLSLACNAILILGAMALGRAAFSLPGIAGVILTFGMAVDANVLIYERIREELNNGKDLRVAVKLGYQKALSSIVDGNVTNLIVCFVLAYTATQEIKGFAITLGIGVVATMFSALIVTRLVFSVLTDKVRVRKMSMLPMAVPFLERLLHPKVNWIGLRYIFIVLSLVYVGLGIGMIAYQGEKMLDTEFRGGTQVDLPFKADADGNPLTLQRPEVEERVHAIGAAAGDEDPLQPLRSATVTALNPEADGITSATFRIKTYATNTEGVLDAVIQEFDEYVDAQPALQFRGADEPDAAVAPARAITSAVLGTNVGRPKYLDDVRDFQGGVVIMLENIEPPVPVDTIETRVRQLRSKPDFSDTLSRRVEYRVLEGSEAAASTVAVLVLDPGLSFFDNEAAWESDVRDREWRLAREALTQATTLASVQSFSAVIAESFRAQAVVAVMLSFLLILIYIWVRFGSVRYSFAAIVALLHDVLTAIGLIALAEIIYETHFLEGAAAALGIEPFKINLNLIAALLTIVGYSLNDTIIIMDRIRENRGKLPYASREVVNLSINQTISRTLITSGTTLVAVLILYIFGGEGVRAFSYALLIGVVVGTYSSVAVASPLVWSGKSERHYAGDKRKS